MKNNFLNKVLKDNNININEKLILILLKENSYSIEENGKYINVTEMSNSEIAKTLNTTIKSISVWINELYKKGYLEQIYFDYRKRKMKIVL